MRYFVLLPILIASPALASTFERPIPQAQSATAELWFGLASLVLIVALAFVQFLVMRR